MALPGRNCLTSPSMESRFYRFLAVRRPIPAARVSPREESLAEPRNSPCSPAPAPDR